MSAPLTTFQSAPSNPPRWLLAAGAGLVTIQVLLSLVNVATWDDGVATSLVDLNTEGNVAAWWSSALLVAMALAASGLWLQGRVLGRPRGIWALVALGFLALSLEEIAGIHERLGFRLGISGDVSDWPILYLPVLTAGAIVLWRALHDLRRPRRRMALAGLGLFVAVVAAEVVSMWTVGDSGDTLTLGETLFEENSEMAGHALILLALSWELAERVAALDLRVGRGASGNGTTVIRRADSVHAHRRPDRQQPRELADVGVAQPDAAV